MFSIKSSLIITVFVILIVCSGCSLLTTRTEAQLSDLTLCRGWDADGKPVVLPNVIPGNETYICICGEFETNQEILLQTIWLGRTKFAQRQVWDSGPFLSCVEDGILEPGQYRVYVLRTKKELGSIDFSISEE
ncbi:MAG: hypothetical protein GY832_40780 [Chloroflexi bacterium]|nr:hypothetical protein [Chloroflexota bacterium]